MIKLLIGGSPCTHWSVAQRKNRETTAEGIGWELFRNYLIAKEKFRPDLFLYENNKSAAQAIRDQISAELGVELIYINSALVSAQNRQRFYAFNWKVEQPEDRDIHLSDILESGIAIREKAYTLDANYYKTLGRNVGFDTQAGRRKMVAEPIPLNDTHGKSYALKAQYGRSSIACYIDGNHFPATAVATPARIGNVENDAQNKQIYTVENGQITIKGRRYPVPLVDGEYIIRKLTVTECCRLQTLPDDYCRAVSNSQAYKGLGNGWTAEVIIHILNGALKDVPRDEEILCLSMYDGIGTGRYCLDKMGFTNVKYYAYEIDRYAMRVANSNYPDIIQCGDAFDVRSDCWDCWEWR